MHIVLSLTSPFLYFVSRSEISRLVASRPRDGARSEEKKERTLQDLFKSQVSVPATKEHRTRLPADRKF